jgi:crotonobetainyl-CoA:carnitine CoA-transferase CaiB-like acyl-CoA transferase
MPEKLLSNIRVVDLAGEPASMASRILADLGADVIKVEPPAGDPLRGALPLGKSAAGTPVSLRFEAWNAGKRSLACETDDPRLTALLAETDIVIDTPGFPGVVEVDPSVAPEAVWVHVTPFGALGPHAGWRATDLGVMAASGNMSATGYPDRAPSRCSEPTGYAHTGPEAAMAALVGLASGRPQQIDLSMQETVMVANMGGVSGFKRTGERGQRRGAQMGRSKEIWRTKDGFVAFGLRGGPARVHTNTLTTKLLTEAGLVTPAWSERDFTKFNPNETSDEEFRALEEPLAKFMEQHTMDELFAIAVEHNWMLAPANSPREAYASPQLQARNFFESLGHYTGFPRRFALARSVDGEVAPIAAETTAPELPAVDAGAPAWRERATRPAPLARPEHGKGALAGVRLVEFGSGAAGPIAARYFCEQGATVVKIESHSRPDFLRIYALGPDNPFGYEGSTLFNALNVNKKSITLNLKDPAGIEVARRIIFWADAVLENFAPKAMRGFGLDYDSLSKEKPDLVMVSSCMNGQTGPQRNYPGFGTQGSALSGFNFLTGWPDREPMGPAGTITDSLSPRFSAAAIASALFYKQRTGHGAYVDVSQVECGLYTLAPWLLDYSVNGEISMRMGNRTPRTAPHGAFPTAGDDRWVAIAVWSDEEWARLADAMGLDSSARERFAGLEARKAEEDDLEAIVSAWTRRRSQQEVEETLQAVGIEAVAVKDFGDLHEDPQLLARDHFVTLPHAVCGEWLFERNGFRLDNAPSGYETPCPILGEHTEEVLRDLLELPEEQVRALLESDGVETELLLRK